MSSNSTATISIDLSYNEISTLQANAFLYNSMAITFIGLSNNLIMELNNDTFDVTSYYNTIDASNDRITSVDQGFSKWLDTSANKMINLSNNPLPCDSKIQRMAIYVICPPLKIILARTESPDGQMANQCTITLPDSVCSMLMFQVSGFLHCSYTSNCNLHFSSLNINDAKKIIKVIKIQFILMFYIFKSL